MQIVKKHVIPIKNVYVIHIISVKHSAKQKETVIGKRKIVISITKFVGQDVVKMMIVRVNFVIKARDCVYQVIAKIKTSTAKFL